MTEREPMEHIVVVGAGMAGARTVDELRLQGHTGRITLLGGEVHPPYDRPPLSKAVLLEDPPPDVTLQHDISSAELIFGRPALSLEDRVVIADSGALPFDGLVIATGADPVRLPGPGEQHVLRTREDAEALRARLLPGARVVVIGASWIGAEVAHAARTRGCAVSCVEAGPGPLHLALGALGERTLPWWEGIDLRCNTGVSSVEDGGLALQDGTFLDADVVVTGVGVRPATGWLAGSGLPVDRGVIVDSGLRVELDREHPLRGRVVAVGDVAARWSPRYDRRLRIEHWDDALSGPTVAASSLLGGDDVFDPLPYFWSDQLGHRLQSLGYRSDTDRLVLREDDVSWSAAWVSPEDVLTAVLAVDRPRDFAQARRACGHTVDVEALADASVAVKDTVR
jgi:NADPH-dependent 2,4-dienoyl-CoA reductase/sulfur reductase-like enzyme